ncbi:MAG: hypothetical protein ACJ76I_14410 [Gaiellaceae bacterium]
MSGGPLIVGISGPDGAGKTELSRRLERELGAEAPVIGVYLYGCIACRRFARPVQRNAGGGRSHRRALRGLLRLHAFVDATELALRLAVAMLRARMRGASVIVTERSPLDGLVKHGAGSGAFVTGMSARLIGLYDVIVCLDVDEHRLVDRDQEHSAGELGLMRQEFKRWSAQFPQVVAVCAGDPADAVAASALAIVAARRERS